MHLRSNAAPVLCRDTGCPVSSLSSHLRDERRAQLAALLDASGRSGGRSTPAARGGSDNKCLRAIGTMTRFLRNWVRSANNLKFDCRRNSDLLKVARGVVSLFSSPRTTVQVESRMRGIHAQVWGTFERCKSSFNRAKLQRNFNNIGVRSFILTGAPLYDFVRYRCLPFANTASSSRQPHVELVAGRLGVAQQRLGARAK